MLQTTNRKLPTIMLIYKPKGNLRTVAIMIEVTSRRMECTLLTSNYSQMPAVALHPPPPRQTAIGGHPRVAFYDMLNEYLHNSNPIKRGDVHSCRKPN